MKCVTSSFQSLFRILREPIDTKIQEIKEVNNTQIPPRPFSRANTDVTRTPTPKMLLDMKSGAIHWPVYQFGGQTGSGMMINSEAIVAKKSEQKMNETEPGRENFSLGEQMEIPLKNSNSKRFLDMDEDERKLIGWLQVRDPNNRKKTFTQVVNPKIEGPFRKAPWHGNVHVMKF